MFTKYCQQQLGITVVKEFMFHDTRKWRFDYAIPIHDGRHTKVAIEVDGGIWTGGRHIRPKGMLNDNEKFNAAAILGWRIIKVTPDALMNISTFEMVIGACDAKL